MCEEQKNRRLSEQWSVHDESTDGIKMVSCGRAFRDPHVSLGEGCRERERRFEPVWTDPLLVPPLLVSLSLSSSRPR